MLLLRQYRVWAQELEDCLQNGLMALWQELVADPNYLAMVIKFDAVLKICHRSKAACIYRQRRLYESIEDMLAKSSLKHADERSITGLEREKVSGEPYAAWAKLLDLRMNLEHAILTVYEQVKDNPAILLAIIGMIAFWILAVVVSQLLVAVDDWQPYVQNGILNPDSGQLQRAGVSQKSSNSESII